MHLDDDEGLLECTLHHAGGVHSLFAILSSEKVLRHVPSFPSVPTDHINSMTWCDTAPNQPKTLKLDPMLLGATGVPALAMKILGEVKGEGEADQEIEDEQTGVPLSKAAEAVSQGMSQDQKHKNNP